MFDYLTHTLNTQRGCLNSKLSASNWFCYKEICYDARSYERKKKKHLNDLSCFCVHPERKKTKYILKKDISNKKYSENLEVPFLVLIYLTIENEVVRNDNSCSSQPVMQGVSLITHSE